MKRDRQRSAVYSWEDKTIAPHDTTAVPFDQIEFIVNHVWAKEGLEHPPQVIPIAKTAKGADATRIKVRFGKTTFTWIILHELAHSMTTQHDGPSNKHGALFLGLYCQLVSRHLNFDFDLLAKSAEEWGLRIKRDAKPVWLE